ATINPARPEQSQGCSGLYRSGATLLNDVVRRTGTDELCEHFPNDLLRLLRPETSLPTEVSATDQQSSVSPAPEAPATQDRRPMTADEANQKAMELAKADRFFIQRSQREWAKLIGCSVGLVAELPLWRETMKRTGRGRKNRTPAPKVVSLTSELEAVTGEGEQDGVLKKLLADHKADSEPSPLDDDPPDSPRKVRSRKRL